ncbi:MAG: DNA helicase [Steroidobacteraceae bacterium]
MKFSAPIYILKQQAKALSRKDAIPLHDALDRIARREGFDRWSLLAASWSTDKSSNSLLRLLRPGELVLLAARPGQGKTLLSLGLAAEWMARGDRAAFFTLEFTRADVLRCLDVLEQDVKAFRGLFTVDDSDGISADHIASRLGSPPPNMFIVIDYLQLLDQRRDTPPLAQQVRRLKHFARQHRAIIVCLSQIDRRYDPMIKPLPALTDIRLPNPLNLKLFDKACLLSQGKVRVTTKA